MNTHFTSAQLVQRPAHSQLDSMAINTPIDSIITYTTDRVQSSTDGVMPAAAGQRVRFRHEHVHHILNRCFAVLTTRNSRF